MPNEPFSRINRSKLLCFLRSGDDAQLLLMMVWFSSEDEVLDWAGEQIKPSSGELILAQC